LRWTGQTGLAVATPTSHGPPPDGMATGEPVEPPPVSGGVAVGAGGLVGVGEVVGAGRALTAGCAVAAGPLAGGALAEGWLDGGPLAAGAGVGAIAVADADAGAGVAAPAGTLQAASRSPSMATQPAKATDRDRLCMAP
jgi:hypothetical protein